MTTWEYAIERATVVERWSSKKQGEEVAAFQQRLNEYGAQGWEMIGFRDGPSNRSIQREHQGLHLPSLLQTAPAVAGDMPRRRKTLELLDEALSHAVRT